MSSFLQPSSEAMTNLLHREAEMLETMISEHNSGRWPDRAPWRVVSAERLSRIWQDAAQLGFVRDEKGLLSIRDRFIDNFLRISVNTAIAGHATYNYNEELGTSFNTEEELESFVSWAVDCETGWRLSDYGIQELFTLCAAASEETDPRKIHVLCDMILNVTHRRSDLASWFVAGGTRTLNALAEGSRPGERPAQAFADARDIRDIMPQAIN